MAKVLEKPSLSQIQNWMSQVITDSHGAEAEGLNWIQTDEKSSREARLSVYSTSYLVRIVEVLESDFKGVHSVLGDEAFVQMTADYLKAYPSRFPNIGEIARNLSLFLESYSATQGKLFLPALASLEWTINESFWANDLSPLDFSKLEDLSEDQWSKACFKLDSSVKLIESSWPVFDIWKSAEFKDYPKSPDVEYLLVYRDAEAEVQVNRLTSLSFDALQKIKGGMSLGMLCSSFETSSDAKDAQVEAWFQEWIQKGILREIILT
jgi:hypothetical protein